MPAEERADEIVRFGPFCLDLGAGCLRGPGDAELPLRPKAFALLCHLAAHPGQLLARDALLDAIWPNVVVSDDSLTQCASELRRVFGSQADGVMKTVSGRGYRFTADVHRARRPAAGNAAAVPSAPAPPVSPQSRYDDLMFNRVVAQDARPDVSDAAGSLSDDLITWLSRCEGLRVIVADRPPPARFSVQGALRAVGAQFRLVLRLEDLAQNAVLWSHTYTYPRDPELAVPEALLLEIAVAVDREIVAANLVRARGRDIPSLTPRELCLLGADHHRRGTEPDTHLARDLFGRATAADPDYAAAHAWLSYTLQRYATNGYPGLDRAHAGQQSLALARRAVEIAPLSPLCQSRLGFALAMHQRWDEALDAVRAALRSTRFICHGSDRNTCTEVLSDAGLGEEAVATVRQELAADPLSPTITRAVLGRALVVAGRSEEAVTELRWAVTRMPDYAPAYHALVVAFSETGRIDEARLAADHVRRLQPGWSPAGGSFSGAFRREADTRRFAEAFVRVGWS